MLSNLAKLSALQLRKLWTEKSREFIEELDKGRDVLKLHDLQQYIKSISLEIERRQESIVIEKG